MAERDVIANQERIIANQEAVLANQARILANQEKIAGNQDKLDRVLENQKKIEKFRKRASGQAPDDSSQPGGEGKGGGTPQVKLGPGQGGDIPLQVPGGGQQGGSGQGTGPGAGSTPGGNLQGEATKPVGKGVDVAAAGVDSGQGEVSSEVVYGAASRGFAGADYRNIYTEYKTVAEEALADDEIPPGYKFYVRRYFQLIRPRE